MLCSEKLEQGIDERYYAWNTIYTLFFERKESLVQQYDVVEIAPNGIDDTDPTLVCEEEEQTRQSNRHKRGEKQLDESSPHSKERWTSNPW